ncbi:MAG: PIN domain-containing protein [Cyanobacteriota bacterium]|nr:PIN domain-containing protein [Cyanobacteriota bacterium]
MRAIIADTGPLYAAIDPDDQYHQRARADLKQIETDNLEVIIAYPVFLEAYSLVLYRLGNQNASAFVKQIVESVDLINPDPQNYLEAMKLVARFSDQKITLFDGITAILANGLGVYVWTYDYHFDLMSVSVWRY